MSYGIKIAKPGKDIHSPLPYDYLLNSEYPIAKIAKESELVTTTNLTEILSFDFYVNHFFPFVSHDNINFFLAQASTGIGQYSYSNLVSTIIFNNPGNNYYKYFAMIDSFDAANAANISPLGSKGLAISKPGKSVYEALPTEFQFKTPYSAFMIYKEDAGVTDGTGNATVSHDLGAIPAFITYDNNSWKGSSAYQMNFSSYVDENNLHIVTGANKGYVYKIMANAIKGTISKSLLNTRGFKIAKEGKHILDSLNDIALDSGLGTVQILQKIELNLSATLDGIWYEFNEDHIFGVVPAFIATITGIGSGDLEYTGLTFPGGVFTGSKIIEIEVAVDSTKVYARIRANSVIGSPPAGGAGKVFVWIYDKLI